MKREERRSKSKRRACWQHRHWVRMRTGIQNTPSSNLHLTGTLFTAGWRGGPGAQLCVRSWLVLDKRHRVLWAGDLNRGDFSGENRG